MSVWHSLSGYLEWKQTSILKRSCYYRRLWWLLVHIQEEPMLLYFNTPDQAVRGHTDGVVRLRGATVESCTSEESHHHFIILTRNSQLLLRADNEQVKNAWICGLRTATTWPSSSTSLHDHVTEEDFRRPSIPAPTATRSVSLNATLRHHSIEASKISTASTTERRRQFAGCRHATTIGGRGRSMSSRSRIHSVELDLKFLTRNRLTPGARVSADNGPNSSDTIGDCPGPSGESEDDVFTTSSTVARGCRHDVIPDDPESEYDAMGTASACSIDPQSCSVSALHRDVSHVSVATHFAVKQESTDSGLPSTNHRVTCSVSDDSTGDKRSDAERYLLEHLEIAINDTRKQVKLSNDRQEVLRSRVDILNDTMIRKADHVKQLDMQEEQMIRDDLATTQTEHLSKICKQFKSLEASYLELNQDNQFLHYEFEQMTYRRNASLSDMEDLMSLTDTKSVELLRFKMEYIILLQSCFSDTIDSLKINHFKKNIGELLEECSLVDPSLPSLLIVARSRHHVDNFGFRHPMSDHDLLPYACSQLRRHLSIRLFSTDPHQAQWWRWLSGHMTGGISGRYLVTRLKEMKPLCRGGVPHHLRSQVWTRIIRSSVEHVIEEHGSHYFESLQKNFSQVKLIHRKQICTDLLKTSPSNVFFEGIFSTGVHDLESVLKSFCLHNPEIEYCKGLNYIAAMALIVMKNPEDAFWCLVAMTEKYFHPQYFGPGCLGAQADYLVLIQLLPSRLPTLADHLKRTKTDIGPITIKWFISLMLGVVPFETALRMWDCFLVEGHKVWFRFAIAILTIAEEALIQENETLGIWRRLKRICHRLYDVDRLIMLAFGNSFPFPRRRDFLAKQTCFINSFREMERQRDSTTGYHRETDWTPDWFSDITSSTTLSEVLPRYRSVLLGGADLTSQESEQKMIDCTAQAPNDDFYIALGQNITTEIYKLASNSNRVYSTGITMDTRITSMLACQIDLLVIGTSTGELIGYNTEDNVESWKVNLQEPILDLISWTYKPHLPFQLVAGLADGNVVLLENPSSCVTEEDVLSITLSGAPIKKLELKADNIWCGCGNEVVVISTKTLEIVGRTEILEEAPDEIETLAGGQDGVWVGMRASFKIYLLDQVTFANKLVYDLRSSLSSTVNLSPGITALLCSDKNLWVGTRQGHVLVLMTEHQMSWGRPADRWGANGGFEDDLGHAPRTVFDKVTHFLEAMPKREEWKKEKPNSFDDDPMWSSMTLKVSGATIERGRKDSSDVPPNDTDALRIDKSSTTEAATRSLVRPASIGHQTQKSSFDDSLLSVSSIPAGDTADTSDFFCTDEHEGDSLSDLSEEESQLPRDPGRPDADKEDIEAVGPPDNHSPPIGPPLSLTMRYRLGSASPIRTLTIVNHHLQPSILSAAVHFDCNYALLIWKNQALDLEQPQAWSPQNIIW